MTPENQQVLDEFIRARQRWVGARLVGLRRSGIFRQTLLGNIGIMLAASSARRLKVAPRLRELAPQRPLAETRPPFVVCDQRADHGIHAAE